MASLRRNQTLELVELAKGAKAIACKWVYRVKLNLDGIISKYKTDLLQKDMIKEKESIIIKPSVLLQSYKVFA